MENRNILNKLNEIAPYLAIVLIAVIMRVIPHPPNFVPIGALALFAGAHFSKKCAFLLPLSAMLISDIIIGFDTSLPYVYGSYFVISLLGGFLKKQSVGRVFSISLISSLLFFLVTNFGVWLQSDMYAKTWSGLATAYAMGIPFFRNTLLGDIAYSFAFFYGIRYITHLLQASRKIEAGSN